MFDAMVMATFFATLSHVADAGMRAETCELEDHRLICALYMLNPLKCIKIESPGWRSLVTLKLGRIGGVEGGGCERMKENGEDGRRVWVWCECGHTTVRVCVFVGGWVHVRPQKINQ